MPAAAYAPLPADDAPMTHGHSMADPAVRARFVALLSRYGQSPMSAQAPNLPRLHVWFGGDAAIPYRAGVGTWLALGPPVAPPHGIADAAQQFVACAQRAHKRAAFFGVENDVAAAADLVFVPCGEDPICLRSRWASDNPHHTPRTHLMRQVRRGARTVRVEAASAEQVARDGTPLLDAFIARQSMPPLAFAATPSLRTDVDGARHWLAYGERGLEGALIALPNAPDGTWLIEAVFRRVGAPNGTSELLIDAAMRGLEGAEHVSLGLLALHGPVPRPLAWARSLGRSLYSFAGLASFRRRMVPDEVRVLGLAYPPTTGALWASVATALAFANGKPLRFAARMLVRGPRLVLWLQALALLPWTLGLALIPWQWCFVAPATQRAWVAFDSVLIAALGSLAYRPRLLLARALATLVTLDVLLTSTEMLFTQPAKTAWGVLLRVLTIMAPLCSACVLWGTHRRLGRLQR